MTTDFTFHALSNEPDEVEQTGRLFVVALFEAPDWRALDDDTRAAVHDLIGILDVLNGLKETG